LEATEDDVRKALHTGTYALTSNWEGVLPEANDPSKSLAAPHIRVALLPGGDDVKSVSVNGSEGWAMLTQSKRKDAAWTLLAYMASPAWQRKAAIITGNYPILSSLYDDPELQQTIQDFPVYGEQFQFLVTRPQLVSYARASDILQTYLHRALLRKLSPKEAMDAAVDAVNRAMTTP
jgi:multiple sugar transport system substrate-binding protein